MPGTAPALHASPNGLLMNLPGSTLAVLLLSPQEHPRPELAEVPWKKSVCARALCRGSIQDIPGCAIGLSAGCLSGGGGTVLGRSPGHAAVWWEPWDTIILAVPWPALGGALILVLCHLF